MFYAASSYANATAILANSRECAQEKPATLVVSFALWMLGLSFPVTASYGKVDGKPALCQLAWSEHAYPHSKGGDLKFER